MKINFKKVIFIIIFIYLIALTGWWLFLPVKPVNVTILEGSSAKDISALLYHSGVISSKTFFLQIVKFTGKTKNLKAGTYSISPRDSVFKVINILTKGNKEYVKVTIPEGCDSNQIAQIISSHNLASSGIFLNQVESRDVEGFLFPETYFFNPRESSNSIIETMLKEFRKNFTADMTARAKKLNMTEKEIVTLASIIEKEAVVPDERYLISGVFHNRLKKKWYLESCATVLYALGKHKKRLTLKDLKIDSPYNTYRNRGLPPGPICNPGLESIKAALYPAKTDDMFFVASSSGTHIFSRYFREHIKNKNKVRIKM